MIYNVVLTVILAHIVFCIHVIC